MMREGATTTSKTSRGGGPDEPPTALEILGVAAREPVISRLFGELIEHGGAAGLGLLSALLGRRVEAPEALLVCLETAFDGLAGDLRRADLVVCWQESQRSCALVIEHKLLAGDSPRQLDDLAAARSQFARLAGNGRPHPAGNDADVTIVRLALFGGDAVPDGVRVVRHADLVSALRAFSVADVRGALAHQWATLVERFVRASMLQPGGTLGDHFATAPVGLDARQARFEAFAHDVAQRAGVELHGVYRTAAQGRAWFGAHLSWAGLYSPDSPRTGWPVDLRRDWWLALQIRLHLPPSPLELTLSLFCETLPYVTRTQFGKLPLAEPDRAGYRMMRAQASEQLKDWKRDGETPWERWRPNGEWCQLASLDRRWRGNDPLATAAGRLAEEIGALRPAVDRLARMLR